MCLKQLQHRSERTLEAGHLCVQNMTFLASEYVKGDFRANGFIGLAPSGDNRSIIKLLKDQNKVDR